MISLSTLVSTSNRTLTVDILSNNNKIGKINGKASIDISVECPVPDEDMIEINVKTIEIPKSPNSEPVTKSGRSFTGKPEKNDIINVITANKLVKKIKL